MRPQYAALTGDELNFVLTRHWQKLGADLNIDDFTDTQAVAAIAHLTRAPPPFSARNRPSSSPARGGAVPTTCPIRSATGVIDGH